METQKNGMANGQMGGCIPNIYRMVYESNIFRHFKWNLISSEVKKKLKLEKDSDGEFYMNFNRDFLKYFGELELVHLTPGSMGEEKSSEKYDVFPFQGKWTGSTAGGCGNDAISKNYFGEGKV